MTKQLILPLAAIILLSSCAGKFGLQKRRYTKGYYVSATKKNHAASKHETENTKHVFVKNTAAKPETVIVNETVKSTETPVATTPLKNEMVRVVKPVNALPVTIQTKQIFASTSKQETTHAVTQFKALDIKKNNVNAKSGGDADVNSVVLVILCIFLPPLAVFLFEKKIGINFWIDLLLCLLFYVPGIIFAFLVCFAGVSL